MSKLEEDIIIRDSDKQFRLRINGFLRRIGVSQIVGTKEYLDIEFIGGELSVRVIYPSKLEALKEAIKRKLLDETQLSLKAIDNIRFYVDDYIEEVELFLRKDKT
jgi:hypothetical protein